MSKKKYDSDPLDRDDPGHPEFAQPVQEGAEISPAADAPVAKPRHEGTVNELMAGWFREAKAATPDPETVGDHFVAYAAERGWALVDADTLPPPEPPPEEPAP